MLSIRGTGFKALRATVLAGLEAGNALGSEGFAAALLLLQRVLAPKCEPKGPRYPNIGYGFQHWDSQF